MHLKAPCVQGVGLRNLPQLGMAGAEHGTASSERADAEHHTAPGNKA